MNGKKTNDNKDLKPLNRILYQDRDRIRKLVREAIIPELVGAIQDHSFKDELGKALGIAV